MQYFVHVYFHLFHRLMFCHILIKLLNLFFFYFLLSFSFRFSFVWYIFQKHSVFTDMCTVDWYLFSQFKYKKKKIWMNYRETIMKKVNRFTVPFAKSFSHKTFRNFHSRSSAGDSRDSSCLKELNQQKSLFFNTFSSSVAICPLETSIISNVSCTSENFKHSRYFLAYETIVSLMSFIY